MHLMRTVGSLKRNLSGKKVVCQRNSFRLRLNVVCEKKIKNEFECVEN